MSDLALYGIILGVWLILQLWVFPKLGIPSCMFGTCGAPAKPPKTSDTNAGKYEGQVDLVNKKN